MKKYGRRNSMPASLRAKKRPKTVKESATPAPQQVKGSHLEVVCMIGLLAKCNPSFENSTQDKENGVENKRAKSGFQGSMGFVSPFAPKCALKTLLKEN